jgi:ribokinase
LASYFDFARRLHVPFWEVANNRSKVVVVGSLNIDQVCRVPLFPCPGETIKANQYQFFRGGKGANQALAAARQGVQVSLIGSLGYDDHGNSYLEHLTAEGIDTAGIYQSNQPTGAAFIIVQEQNGENMIVVAGGANELLNRGSVFTRRRLIESGSVLLTQFEISIPAVTEAIEIANRASIPVILNASPIIHTFPWEDYSISHLIINQKEAHELWDTPIESLPLDTIRQHLHDFRVENLIVTRGSEPTLVYSREGDFFEVEPLPVLPIDTVGAGDAFAGCFAARIAEGASVEDAVRAANCCGALTTLGAGAQSPIPDRQKVDQHLEQIPRRKIRSKRV